jgi:hypothetical protein
MNALSPHEVSTKMMTPEEARRRVTVINSGINNLRAQIMDFHDREGWKALGYENWVECVKKEFSIGQSRVYQLFEAAQIEQNISTIVENTAAIPESQLRPLAAVPPEDQATVYQLAKETAPEGKVTAKHVENVVREIKGEEPRKTAAPRTYAPGSLLKETSDAMLLATAAIEALERIDKKDPQRKAAIVKVAEWCWRQRQPNDGD